MHRANQEAFREAGGVEAVVQLLEGGGHLPVTAAAAWLIASAARRNPANKDAICEVLSTGIVFAVDMPSACD